MATSQPEKERQATDREMWTNGFADCGSPICAWCGKPSDEMVVYGIPTPNGWAWSPAYCGWPCHVEAVGDAELTAAGAVR